MRIEVIELARESLRDLQQSFRDLEKGLHLREAERAWGLMLHYSDQIYNRLKLAPENGKEQNWYNQEVRVRKSEPLLQYAMQARNAAHHGIDQSTQRRADGSAILRERIPRNFGDLPPPGCEPPLFLVPVQSRGVTYPVPTTFNGLTIGDPTVLTIALLLEMAMRALVQQAEFIATDRHG